MTCPRTALWTAATICLVLLPGCKKPAAADASQPLVQSFQAAEPATRQAIETVTSHLKSGNYADAARTLGPIVSQPLTAQQKQAISLAIQQLNQAIEKNPSLDTREMYELRRRMFQAVDGGSRF